MKTKTLLHVAIILALPITANATGPAHDSGNNPTVATASAPYQTVTPEAHADEHIASTQYVIGAYNDAIAAVNNVADTVRSMNADFTEGINSRLLNSDDDIIDQDVIDNKALTRMDLNGVMDAVLNVVHQSDEWEAFLDDVFRYELGNDGRDENLITLGAALRLAGETGKAIQGKQIQLETSINGQNQNINSTVSQTIGQTPSATSLVSAAGVANYVNNKRVEIYTTWENDNAKQQVAFVNAQ